MNEIIKKLDNFEMLALKGMGGKGGGGAITNGIVVKEITAGYRPLKATVYGEHIAPRAFRSYYHNSIYDGAWYECEELIFDNNVKYIHDSACSTMRALKALNTNNVINIASRAFSEDISLVSADLPNVEQMFLDNSATDSNYTGGEFYGCVALERVNAPKLIKVNRGTFGGCTSLKSVYLPKCVRVVSRGTANNVSTFGGCTSLENVEIGSIDNGIVELNNNSFYNCTQSTLTVTAYTTTALKDTILANIRNGATNATIIIKDSTTGETLVTSTPT